MDYLQSLRVFAKVAELGSFIRAALQLDISAATTTRHIVDLESHLGTRLLNRTTRQLSLTEAGQAYLQRVIQVLGDVARRTRLPCRSLPSRLAHSISIRTSVSAKPSCHAF